jgi:hypothetical protein
MHGERHEQGVEDGRQRAADTLFRPDDDALALPLPRVKAGAAPVRRPHPADILDDERRSFRARVVGDPRPRNHAVLPRAGQEAPEFLDVIVRAVAVQGIGHAPHATGMFTFEHGIGSVNQAPAFRRQAASHKLVPPSVLAARDLLGRCRVRRSFVRSHFHRRRAASAALESVKSVKSVISDLYPQAYGRAYQSKSPHARTDRDGKSLTSLISPIAAELAGRLLPIAHGQLVAAVDHTPAFRDDP